MPGFEPKSAEHAALAKHLAARSAMGPCTVTEEEEAVLLARSTEAAEASTDAAGSARVAKALASLGITWAGPIAAADAAVTERTRGAREALGAPQVQLLEAASRGDVATVRALLAQGADRDCRASDEMFLDHGAQMVRRTRAPLTPLVLAAMRGHVEVVEVLLDAGARVDMIEGRPMPVALFIALTRGHVAMIERLLPHAPAVGADDELRAHLESRRPMGGGGDIDLVRLLVVRGATCSSEAVRRGVVFTAEQAGDEELAARFRDAD